MIKASTMRSRLALVVALGTAAASVLGAGPATAAARPGRHVLTGSQPRWLGRARATGSAPAAARPSSSASCSSCATPPAAEATLASISDPASASYGKWLTTSQFKPRYAPAAADVDAVQSWLKGQGFALRDTLGGMYVEASGTTAQINKVFGTTLKNYSYQGKTVHANSTALSLPENTPSAVIGVVSGVLGLDQGTGAQEAGRHAARPGHRLPARHAVARRTTARRSRPPSRPRTARSSRTWSAATSRSSTSRRTASATRSSTASTAAA